MVGKGRVVKERKEEEDMEGRCVIGQKREGSDIFHSTHLKDRVGGCAHRVKHVKCFKIN